MTKSESSQIAKALREVLRTRGSAEYPDVEYALDDIANAIADICAANAPDFDRVHFLSACDIESVAQ